MHNSAAQVDIFHAGPAFALKEIMRHKYYLILYNTENILDRFRPILIYYGNCRRYQYRNQQIKAAEIAFGSDFGPFRSWQRYRYQPASRQ